MVKTKMPIDTVAKLLGVKRAVLIKFGKRLEVNLNQGVSPEILATLIMHYGNDTKKITKKAKQAYIDVFGLKGYGLENYFSSHVN